MYNTYVFRNNHLWFDFQTVINRMIRVAISCVPWLKILLWPGICLQRSQTLYMDLMQ